MREGWIDVLFAGNALAAHDIEAAIVAAGAFFVVAQIAAALAHAAIDPRVRR